MPPWVSAIVLSAVIAPPVIDQTLHHSLHHELYAGVTGERHLGQGIYFDDGDWDAILESLTGEERALLEAPDRDDRAVVKLFTEKLNGDYDESRIPRTEVSAEDEAQNLRPRRYSAYLTGISARHFVVNRGRPRGNCEAKALVLAECLRRLGYDAFVEHALVREFRAAEPMGHGYVLVRFPDGRSWIADPTRGEVMGAAQYRIRFYAQEIDYFGRPSPPPGK